MHSADSDHWLQKNEAPRQAPGRAQAPCNTPRTLAFICRGVYFSTGGRQVSKKCTSAKNRASWPWQRGKGKFTETDLLFNPPASPLLQEARRVLSGCLPSCRHSFLSRWDFPASMESAPHLLCLLLSLLLSPQVCFYLCLMVLSATSLSSHAAFDDGRCHRDCAFFRNYFTIDSCWLFFSAFV